MERVEQAREGSSRTLGELQELDRQRASRRAASPHVTPLEGRRGRRGEGDGGVEGRQVSVLPSSSLPKSSRKSSIFRIVVLRTPPEGRETLWPRRTCIKR